MRKPPTSSGRSCEPARSGSSTTSSIAAKTSSTTHSRTEPTFSTDQILGVRQATRHRCGAPGVGAAGHTGGMCASYGLETSVADLHVEFGVMDERGSDAALQEWLDTWGTHAVKPTGSRARNLNPIVRERERDDRTVRTIDLAWWKLWVGGAPAKFPAINARAEGILDSGAWRRPFERRRVLVPATEYHEKGHRFALDTASQKTV